MRRAALVGTVAAVALLGAVAWWAASRGPGRTVDRRQPIPRTSADEGPTLQGQPSRAVAEPSEVGKAHDQPGVDLPAAGVDACRLRVRLVTEDGAPVPGVNLRVREYDLPDLHVLDAFLAGRLDEETASLPAWRHPSVSSDAEGRFELRSSRGAVILLTGTSPLGRLPVEHVVRVDDHGCEASLDLVVPAVRSVGMLRVRWSDTDGRLVPKPTTLLETALGTVVQGLERHEDLEERGVEVPAGAFFVRLESATRRSEVLFGEPFREDWLLSERIPVTIDPARPALLEVPARDGGRLRVHCEIPRKGWPTLLSDKSSGPDSPPIVARALRAERLDDPPIELAFAFFDGLASRAGPASTERLERWVGQTYTRLAPGRWRVQAKRWGDPWVRSDSVEAEVRAREVTDVPIVLPE